MIAGKLDEREKRDWDLQYEKYNRDQTIKEIVNESSMLDASSKRNINETISETNRLNSNSNRKINELDADSRRKVQEEMVNVEKRRIEAFRQIGVAAAENQPKVKYKLLKN